MKPLLLATSLLLLPLLASAQQVEWSGQLTTGVAAFRGASAESSSAINVNDSSPEASYTNNPYGSRWGLSYGAAVQGQFVGRRGLLLGAQLGYDLLRPAVRITSVNTVLRPTNTVEGKAHLNNQFVGLNPYLGQRLRMGEVALDVTLGLEIARQLACREKADYTLNGNDLETDRDRATQFWDNRLRAGLALSRGPVSLTASYAHGLSNYKEGWVGGVNEAYMRVLRLGLAYRFH
ncbi:hypothetical protein [Hymenobacter guriensis]|uniref:PorT family protein n=1 Tax=Hymenobacter guriensis TaxID=2793065 RepID=A0ABS0L5D8_9BACT|nr:hypothetical protein [Hymenobacter guriensis]MBG8555333.1 hypothetical protein [Hymenobacter guriensis]